jgi:hypothetical protein
LSRDLDPEVQLENVDDMEWRMVANFVWGDDNMWLPLLEVQ